MRRISALPFSPDYFAVTLVMRIIFFSFFFHGGKEYFRIHTELNVDRVVVVVARRDVICEKIYPNIYIYIFFFVASRFIILATPGSMRFIVDPL